MEKGEPPPPWHKLSVSIEQEPGLISKGPPDPKLLVHLISIAARS